MAVFGEQIGLISCLTVGYAIPLHQEATGTGTTEPCIQVDSGLLIEKHQQFFNGRCMVVAAGIFRNNG